MTHRILNKFFIYWNFFVSDLLLNCPFAFIIFTDYHRKYGDNYSCTRCNKSSLYFLLYTREYRL